MPKEENNKEKILKEINQKLDLLILVTSLSGKDKEEQKRILKNYNGPLSKRELEKITGIDRHRF